MRPNVAAALQSDLRSLSVESRRRHADVKEAAERALLEARSLKDGGGGADGGALAASVGQFELIARPLTMACRTGEAELALIAVGCLHKLIAQDVVPLESLSSILGTLADQAAGTDDEGVQAKLLQTVLSLLASTTYPVRRDDLSRAFSICLALHNGSSTLINNTATATLRQAVSLLFERVGCSEGAASESPAGEADSALSCTYLLVHDLCSLADRQTARWLRVSSLDLELILELLESVLLPHAAVFVRHGELLALLRDQVCPLAVRLLSGQPEFGVLQRTVRLAWPIVKHFTAVLPEQCGRFVRRVVGMLPSQAAGSWENEGALWKRTVAMEMLSLLVADRKALQELVLLGKDNGLAVCNSLVSGLFCAIKYGLLEDKVFPSLAGSQRRVGLQLLGEPQPNTSAGYALSLGIGAMIHMAEAMLTESGGSDGSGDGHSRAEQAARALAVGTWQPLLRMFALVLDRCKALEMVEAVLGAYVSLAKTAATHRLDDAMGAVMSAMGDLASARAVPLSEKDVAVCGALFRCIAALGAQLDSKAWLQAVSFLEYVDDVVGDPKAPVGDGRTEKEHRLQLLELLSEFYVDTSLLDSAAFERMATALDALQSQRLAERDVQYREAPLTLPRPFAVVCWPRMFDGNVHRFDVCWALIVTHLRKATTHQNILISKLAVDALFQVITSALCMTNMVGTGVGTDQLRILEPLSTLSQCGSDDCQTHLLGCLYTLLESSGHELNRGWSLVLAIIQHCAGSDTSTVAAAAFRSVQLIVTDFLSSMPVEHCQLCVVTVGQFRAHCSDMNMNLTAIGQLWNIADYFGREQKAITGALEAAAAGTPALNPTPYPVADSTALDPRAMAASADSNAREFVCPAMPKAAAAHMGRLWRTLFAEMQLSCDDPRPEVRKCALRTLMSTLASHGDLFGPSLWDELLWNTLFPVMASVHAAAVTADESKEGNSTVGATLGAENGEAVPLMMHHSRNTLSKQWDETRVLALNGATRVFCSHLPAFCSLDCAGTAWELLLEFAEASLRHRSQEVVAAAIEAVNELFCESFCATDDGTEAHVDQMRKLWEAAVLMMSEVTAQVTIELGGPNHAVPHRPTWIRMPSSPGLSERSLLLLMNCTCDVHAKVSETAWISHAHTEDLAVVVDRLVHYSMRFEQPVVYKVIDGEECSITALSPAQERARSWMRRVMEREDSAAEPQLHRADSVSTLLLLHCLRYLPGGAAAVGAAGGHPRLHRSAELDEPQFSLPLAVTALALVLEFFRTSVHETELSAGTQKFFALTVKALVAAATATLDSGWSAFQTDSIRGVLSTVRSGMQVHSSAERLDVVCEELVAVGRRYLSVSTTAAIGADPGIDATQPPESIGLEVAACVTDVLLSPAVQTGALSRTVQRQLVQLLDVAAVPNCAVDTFPGQQAERLSAVCLQGMFRVCQGGAAVAATALPFLFARCEGVLQRYSADAKRSGPGGLPVARWQQDELARLLEQLCDYQQPMSQDEASIAQSAAGEDARLGRSPRLGLVTRLLPPMCAVSALGPGMLNRRTSAGLARAVHLGFVELGLESPFLVPQAQGGGGHEGGGGAAGTV